MERANRGGVGRSGSGGVSGLDFNGGRRGSQYSDHIQSGGGNMGTSVPYRSGGDGQRGGGYRSDSSRYRNIRSRGGGGGGRGGRGGIRDQMTDTLPINSSQTNSEGLNEVTGILLNETRKSNPPRYQNFSQNNDRRKRDDGESWGTNNWEKRNQDQKMASYQQASSQTLSSSSNSQNEERVPHISTNEFYDAYSAVNSSAEETSYLSLLDRMYFILKLKSLILIN
jgi:hypothetical protein